MFDKKISIIVPIYNSEKYLNKCLSSIVNQTYENLEIILINDGSTDSSKEICDKYAIMDKRIKVIHKENEGLVAARKTGIEYATGYYLTFVDSDDYMDLNAYKNLTDKLGIDNPDIVSFGLIEEYPEYSIIKKNKFKADVYNIKRLEKDIFPIMLSYKDFFDFGILPNLVCKLVKNSFLKNIDINIDNRVTVGEDVDFTYQMIINANSLQIIDEEPYHYCKHEDSMMWKPLKQEYIMYLYNDLYKAFQKSKYKNILQMQLEEYITFVSLLKTPKEIIGKKFDLINNKFALYGAGGFGQAIYKEYNENVIIWVDKKNSINGFDIDLPDKLFEIEYAYDFIFIAILNVKTCKEVRQNLVEKGITKPIYFFEL